MPTSTRSANRRLTTDLSWVSAIDGMFNGEDGILTSAMVNMWLGSCAGRGRRLPARDVAAPGCPGDTGNLLALFARAGQAAAHELRETLELVAREHIVDRGGVSGEREASWRVAIDPAQNRDDFRI